jgi:triacylglycerol esterase/lipase EstA (alpha/beta hydrolase family)
MCSYENLWEAPIVLVGHSFGGLMLKSLVVEVSKRMHQRSMPSLDVEVRDNCKKFLENVKGMVFYSVPRGGDSQEFSSFLASQCLQTNVIDKKIKHGSNNLNSFNRQMEQLDVDFTHSTDQNVYNMLVFSEGLPINDKQVSLTSNCTIYFILLIRLLVYRTFSN